ncbi:helix-turn-helix domain-containing protein [Clostridium lacusfryxellense]|uniref:helix-turn-helix domain-containing protein n=1 Tax=Clostridium lacusfryxellense TaxID=205328 RepID=UPI001C0C0276|nr:helix-turn-helix domain-containing protein [Clostridium lacusfryxellense]MBU3114854.1 helix-turn-helix domain-containing protein [Clostridium lacusfryxellense]
MSKPKCPAEQKLQAVEDYLNGVRGVSDIMNDLSIASARTIRQWISVYQISGVSAFVHKSKNNSYSKDFKQKVVEEYIDGKGSLSDIAAKYKIAGHETLRRWILLYNSNMELKDYAPKQEVYMAEARRKTTIEERNKIVVYCIENGRNYKDTAEKYDVSYSQVYSWVRKYDNVGEEGLTDKRGRHKSDDEVDELEKLRRENKRLKYQIEERDMTVELLKKVKEFERRRF